MFIILAGALCLVSALILILKVRPKAGEERAWRQWPGAEILFPILLLVLSVMGVVFIIKGTSGEW